MSARPDGRIDENLPRLGVESLAALQPEEPADVAAERHRVRHSWQTVGGRNYRMARPGKFQAFRCWVKRSSPCRWERQGELKSEWTACVGSTLGRDLPPPRAGICSCPLHDHRVDDLLFSCSAPTIYCRLAANEPSATASNRASCRSSNVASVSRPIVPDGRERRLKQPRAEAGELNQPLRESEPARAIHIDGFRLGEIKPAKNPCLRVGGRARHPTSRRILLGPHRV